jgi:N-acyl-D-amino-acid deacylase
MTRRFLLFVALLAIFVGACQPGPPAGEPTARASAAPSLATASASASAPTAPFVSKERFQLLIADATIVDGTGAKPVVGDVLVQAGRIAHVGEVAEQVQVDRRIDGRGLVVAPGFIDAHSHGEPLRDNQHLLMQGVTTIVIGQDGLSPSNDRMAVWVARTKSRSLAINVVPLVGHGSVRILANVGASKDPGPERIAKMKKLVEEELAAGAWGLSTALEYEPGTFAGADELAALAEPVARIDGIVMSHMRSEDDDKIAQSLDELIAQGERSGARVHVAHVKIVHGKGQAVADELLARMQAARKRGLRLTADAYPYTASYTSIGIVFPEFAKPPNDFDDAKQNRRQELVAYLRQRVTKRGGPGAILFGTPPYRGSTLAQVAAEKGQPYEEVLLDLGPLGSSAAFFVMDEATQDRLLLDKHVMIGADGSPGSGHPRAYGTFARLLRLYVVKHKRLSIEEAVRKMTGLAAETVGLTRQKRGLLRAGWAADLVVFDPQRIEDPADYKSPNEMARGMRWVLINGRAVIDDGRFDRNVQAGALLLR